jgi:hypothetical protein
MLTPLFCITRQVTRADINNSSIISRTAFASTEFGFVPCMVYNPPSDSDVTSLYENIVRYRIIGCTTKHCSIITSY